MEVERLYVSYFYIKPRKLQIIRVERHGSATILWLSRNALLRYLNEMEVSHNTREHHLH